MLDVVLPLKSLSAAKSRLSSALSGEQRQALTVAMARDVMATLLDWPETRSLTVIVGEGWRELLVDLPRRNLRVLQEDVPEAGDPASHLNSAVNAALANLNDAVVVIHGDLPWLSRADLDLIAEALHAGNDAVIAPDRHGSGTNLMAFARASDALCQFGGDSFARHRERLTEAGLAYKSVSAYGLSHDLDTPEDLALLTSAASAQALLDKPAERAISAETTSAMLKAMPTEQLVELAGEKALAHYGRVLTYSPKVFIPLTKLCRDVCHYCTFAQRPKQLETPYMSLEAVLETVRAGETAGCQEALLTLGEKPELRYRVAREWLAEQGYHSTVDYVIAACKAILDNSGLLPHVNAGTLSLAELRALKPYMASMGIMLESGSRDLIAKGGAHHGSPDKIPTRRFATLARAGRLAIPTTTGLLIGIGERPEQRIKDLKAIARLHQRYGHIQEVIIQNFRAKPETLMRDCADASSEELRRTVALARLILPADISVQIPPNLNPDDLGALIGAGINDWGGISPVTPDHVNPEAPWPEVAALAEVCASYGRLLQPRLAVYAPYLRADAQAAPWLAPDIRRRALAKVDAEGLLRQDDWAAGGAVDATLLPGMPSLHTLDGTVAGLLARRVSGDELTEAEIARLFHVRDIDLHQIFEAADALRRDQVGDAVSFVVNRNINYTNVCQYACNFCAFSKGLPSDSGRDRPYDIDGDELRRRTREAWALGATEVCLQGGIHPAYTGETYLSIVRAVKEAEAEVHVHAFSPLEIQHGATTLGLSIPEYLAALREAGLDTLPGTAAEILHDDVRALICPDKLNTAEWLEVMAAAHGQGLRSTATMMFGHVEGTIHWARHLLHIRQLQQRTGGFTEFVPLPFVAAEAPMSKRGLSRPGPTRREAGLVYAVARIILGDVIPNIQASWVKLGRNGALESLSLGVNDLGGCLMNESISRAAGSAHGQCWAPDDMESAIRAQGREPRLRTTLYSEPNPEQAARWRSQSFVIASTSSPMASLKRENSGPRLF